MNVPSLTVGANYSYFSISDSVRACPEMMLAGESKILTSTLDMKI